MMESKSGRTFNEINAHSERLRKFTSISLNRLAGNSERQKRPKEFDGRDCRPIEEAEIPAAPNA
jgi:hypothetical protein